MSKTTMWQVQLLLWIVMLAACTGPAGIHSSTATATTIPATPTATASSTPMVTAVAIEVEPTTVAEITSTPFIEVTEPILDGSLVFASARLDTNNDGLIGLGDGRQLYLLNLATGEERQVTTGNYFDTEPAWSPDGRQIVFSSNRTEDGSFALFVVNHDGSQLQQLTTVSGNARNPTWSPSGEAIAFVHAMPDATGYETRQIALYLLDTGQVEWLTTGLDSYDNSSQPVWLPNGRGLTFMHGRQPSSGQLGELGVEVSLEMIDIETRQRHILAHENELQYKLGNFQWFETAQGQSIVALETVNYLETVMLFFALDWQEKTPHLNQLSLGLTASTWQPLVWISGGEWIIYEKNIPNQADNSVAFKELGAVPFPFFADIQIDPNKMSIYSLELLDGHQQLTDNSFLDHQANWIFK